MKSIRVIYFLYQSLFPDVIVIGGNIQNEANCLYRESCKNERAQNEVLFLEVCIFSPKLRDYTIHVTVNFLLNLEQTLFGTDISDLCFNVLYQELLELA